ncbi:hypothetical protein P3T18_003596 [Paraburkholderia sp. GAS199]
MSSNNLDPGRIVAVRVDSCTFKALRYLAVDQDKTVSALLREEAQRLTGTSNTTHAPAS